MTLMTSLSGLTDHYPKAAVYLPLLICVDFHLDKAHTGLIGDGIVAVSSVDQLYRIRTKTLLK